MYGIVVIIDNNFKLSLFLVGAAVLYAIKWDSDNRDNEIMMKSQGRLRG